MGKLALYLFGALWVGGVLIGLSDRYGAISVALMLGGLAWYFFGRAKP